MSATAAGRATMRTVSLVELTGPDGVRPLELERPRLPADAGPEGPVLVDVHAAGVAFPDLLRSHGRYQERAELPHPVGSEVAGVVRAAPPGSRFAVGQRIAGLVRIGGVAETALLPVDWAIVLPDEVSFAVGAGIVLNYVTGCFALRRAEAVAGESVVVHGAAGGVGTATLQLARDAGLRTIGVVSDAAKGDLARACGADEVVRSDRDWLARVRELTGGAGADVVVDPVGGPVFDDSVRCLRAGGRLMVVGFAGGEIPRVTANRLLLRNVAVMGTAIEGYDDAHPGALADVVAEVQRLTERGVARPPVGMVVELDRAADALRALAERRALGKIVVAVRPEGGA